MWYVLGAIVYLILDYFIAVEFGRIAEMKGHSLTRYFWFTFIFGLVGMLMVAALPYINNAPISPAADADGSVSAEKAVNTPDELTDKLPESRTAEDNSSSQPVKADVVNGEKVCPKCGLVQRAERIVCWKCGQRFEN